MSLFNIKKQHIPTPEEEFNAMLGSDQNNTAKKIVEISIDLLDEIPQKFVFRPEKAKELAESIAEVGVIDPLSVREKKNGRYDIIAGRHRRSAAKLAGLETVPCIVLEVNKDTAELVMLCTNLHRNNNYTFSELAFAYKQQADLFKKIGSNAPSIKEIAEQNNTNRKKIQRYIRLTELIPTLLNLVDNKELPFVGGVELSYLKKDDQKTLFSYMLKHDTKLSVEQCKKIRTLAADTAPTPENIKALLEKDKTVLPQLEGQIAINGVIDNSENTSPINAIMAEPGIEGAVTNSNHVNALDETKTDIKDSVIEDPSNSKNINKQGDYITNADIKLFIKAYYDRTDLFAYYVFKAPTPVQAIKEKLKAKENKTAFVQFMHGRKGQVTFFQSDIVLQYFAGTGCISYKEIDKCIRELIRSNTLLPGNEMLKVIKKHFEKMGLKE